MSPTSCFEGCFNTLLFPLSYRFIHVHFLPSIFAGLHVTLSSCFSNQLQLWDTAGQERFRKSMVQHYYRNVHAMLFVYDVTCPASFSSLSSWLEECRQNSLGQDIPRWFPQNFSALFLCLHLIMKTLPVSLMKLTEQCSWIAEMSFLKCLAHWSWRTSSKKKAISVGPSIPITSQLLLSCDKIRKRLLLGPGVWWHLVPAKAISMDVAVAAVLSELGGIL